MDNGLIGSRITGAFKRTVGQTGNTHKDFSTVFTDGLARLFSLSLPALGMVRGAGLLAFDLLPPAKRLLTRMTMGRASRLPRLARGLPL